MTDHTRRIDSHREQLPADFSGEDALAWWSRRRGTCEGYPGELVLDGARVERFDASGVVALVRLVAARERAGLSTQLMRPGCIGPQLEMIGLSRLIAAPARRLAVA
jgi:ABC-type transporter Mla MlaB component